MLKDKRKSVVNDKIWSLILPSRMDILMLLYDKRGYASLDEIYKKTDHRFRNKSHLLSCLREEIMEGLIEKRVEKELSFYKITPKGKSVIEKSMELAKILEG